MHTYKPHILMKAYFKVSSVMSYDWNLGLGSTLEISLKYNYLFKDPMSKKKKMLVVLGVRDIIQSITTLCSVLFSESAT